MRSDEEDEEYEDFQEAEDEDVDDDDETAFDDVDYGLEEGDGEGEPSHRLANVFSCRIESCWNDELKSSDSARLHSAPYRWSTVNFLHHDTVVLSWPSAAPISTDCAWNLFSEEKRWRIKCHSFVVVSPFFRNGIQS